MICFFTALSSATGIPPGFGRVWPPVWVTGAECTHPPCIHGDKKTTSGPRSTFPEPGGRSGGAQHLPGALDVAGHGDEQVLDPLEGGHRAQPGHELDADVLAVEVAVVVEDVGLHRAPAALEGRVGADRDGGRQ